MLPVNQLAVKKMMINLILRENIKDTASLVKKDVLYFTELIKFIWSKSAMLCMPLIYLTVSLFYFMAILVNEDL